jgi:hypothetical protein
MTGSERKLITRVGSLLRGCAGNVMSCAVRVFCALQQLSEEAVVKPPAEKKRHMGLTPTFYR